MMLLDLLSRLPVGLALFILALGHRPREAFRALGVRFTGKRLRAMNILRRALVERPALYRIWLRKVEPGLVLGFTHDGDAIGNMVPCIFAKGRSSEALEVTLASLPKDVKRLKIAVITQDHAIAGQLQHIRTIDPGAFLSFAEQLHAENPGAMLVPIRCGDQLAASALAAYATAALSAPPDVALLYGDEDEIDGNGRRNNPWFKPDWNALQFLSQDFISGACAIPIRNILPVAGSTSINGAASDVSRLVYSILLDRPAQAVLHLPIILCHRAVREPEEIDEAVSGRVAAYLSPGGAVSAGRAGTRRVDHPLPSPLPKVTAIVPTRDRVSLLRTCLAGLAATDYPDLEVIVVDNDSVEPATIEFLKTAVTEKVGVIHFPGTFNFASMNNLAARNASGSLLCFVNNDIEFIDPTWLKAMVRQAIRPEVGAVGAKLLYPDRSLQHVGVVIGLGGAAGHMHKHMQDSSDACHAAPHVQRQVSAVTAACMLVSRAKFHDVNGFDETNFPVAFNDVDLCLRLQAAGYVNCYEPHAVALHHESLSRGDDLAAANVERYRRELAALQARWNTSCAIDPNWNINLDYSCEQMSIRL